MIRSRALPVLLALLFGATIVLQVREIGRQGLQQLEGGDEAPSSAVVPLEEHRGRVVVVNFWASWCGPCRLEMPELATLKKDWDSKEDGRPELVWIAVNAQEDPEEVRGITGDPRYTGLADFRYDRDGAVGRQWKVRAFPTTYVVGPDGTVAGGTVGFDGNTRWALDRLTSDFVPKEASK